MDDVLDFLHLLGAALWLGGLATLAVVLVVARSSLDQPAFRLLARRAGRAFAGLSALAWALLAGSGLALGFHRGWPGVVVLKLGLGAGVILAAVVHSLAGMRTGSRAAVGISRALSALIFAATLVLFWLGVRAAA